MLCKAGDMQTCNKALSLQELGATYIFILLQKYLDPLYNHLWLHEPQKVAQSGKQEEKHCHSKQYLYQHTHTVWTTHCIVLYSSLVNFGACNYIFVQDIECIL